MELTDTEIETLRYARGIGLTSFEPTPMLLSLWERGLVVRDNEKPYTFRTIEDVARQFDEIDARSEEETQ